MSSSSSSSSTSALSHTHCRCSGSSWTSRTWPLWRDCTMTDTWLGTQQMWSNDIWWCTRKHQRVFALEPVFSMTVRWRSNIEIGKKILISYLFIIVCPEGDCEAHSSQLPLLWTNTKSASLYRNIYLFLIVQEQLDVTIIANMEKMILAEQILFKYVVWICLCWIKELLLILVVSRFQDFLNPDLTDFTRDFIRWD